LLCVGQKKRDRDRRREEDTEKKGVLTQERLTSSPFPGEKSRGEGGGRLHWRKGGSFFPKDSLPERRGPYQEVEIMPHEVKKLLPWTLFKKREFSSERHIARM